MEATARVEGSLKDVMPLARELAKWGEDHYIVVMLFILALAALMAWRKRR